LWVVSPKVDAMPQPVIIVSAGFEPGFPANQLVSDGLVAPVKSENKGGQGGIHD